jgi:hypothetical protein
MVSTKPNTDAEDEGTFWRRMTLPVEDRSSVRVSIDARGQPKAAGYRWFRSENVCAIEHFRGSRKVGQRPGRFGWV